MPLLIVLTLGFLLIVFVLSALRGGQPTVQPTVEQGISVPDEIDVNVNPGEEVPAE